MCSIGDCTSEVITNKRPHLFGSPSSSTAAAVVPRAVAGSSGSKVEHLGCVAGDSPAPESVASSSESRAWCCEDFELGPKIGTGTFGHAQLARVRSAGALVVLKVMRKRRIERLRMQRHVAHEIKIHAHLCHPRIIRLFGFFWDHSCIYMILEHASGGDLYSLLQKQPSQNFEESVAAPFISQLASAVAYCHRMHVIHRDLKPQNALISQKVRLKLADFGWAAHTYPEERRWTLCGTLDYLPPEMVHATRGHSFEMDAWGLGILTYELLVGQPPFVASEREETYRLILSAAANFPATLSDQSCDFVKQLLRRNPEERMKPEEMASHEWIRQHVHSSSGGLMRSGAYAGA